MGKAQDLFDQATRYYDDSIELVKLMDKTFQEIAFRNDPSSRYDTKITLAQFDWILQAVLLSQALSDGNFDRLERQFVDKITDHGDLLGYIKNKTNGELALSWDGIASLSASTQQKLVKILPAPLDETCDSFAKPLALLDKASKEVDELNALVEYIGKIGACLAQVDGRVTDEEAESAANMVVSLLVARWQAYMR
ncbi:MAG: hypothetical protein LUE21_04725 [Oscillospiraceae bacterium]|nr:hypothetical protein [Oscillospiraceae bacterium]